MFTDVATVKVQAGKGGDGRLNFYRTRGNATGGPDGGDGGDGGNVIARADHNTSTLSKYRSAKLWAATDGGSGGPSRSHGKNGGDIVLPVAPGTVISDGDEVIADLTHDGDEAIVAYGGRGGFGNAHFKSSVRQSPKLAELGEPGESKKLKFELKIVADVGLVGLPNAGKSTLLSIISGAKPEIADYPFTTLIPNLGVVDIDDHTFLAADIPGLIEGASKGKGLGDDFLRHVERTRVLLHLIDINSEDVVRDYTTIQKELAGYAVDLSAEPQLVVLTKCEGMQTAEIDKKVAQLVRATKVKKASIFRISAVAGMGIATLLRATNKLLQTQHDLSAAAETASKDELPVIRLDESKIWEVHKKGESFVVTGVEIEGFAKRTNPSQYQAVQRLRHILDRKGILTQIRRMGGAPGAKIIIGTHELTW